MSLFSDINADIIAIIAAVFGLSFYLFFIRWLARYDKPTWFTVALAIFWGSVWAIFASLFLEIILSTQIEVIWKGNYREPIAATFMAPLVEESTKGLGVLLIFLFFRKNFNGILDGIIYGMIVGLAFAVVEDVEYYLYSFQDNQLAGEIGVIILRGFVLGLNHSYFTSMTGIGLGLIRFRRFGPLKFIIPLLGLATAMFFHAAHNSVSFYQEAQTSVRTVMALSLLFYDYFGIFCLIIVTILVNNRLKRRLSRELVEEVHRGTIDTLDYKIATSYRERVRARTIALFKIGPRRFWELGQFFQAVTDLALHKNLLHEHHDRYSPPASIEKMRLKVFERKARMLLASGLKPQPDNRVLGGRGPIPPPQALSPYFYAQPTKNYQSFPVQPLALQPLPYAQAEYPKTNYGSGYPSPGNYGQYNEHEGWLPVVKNT